jgi:cyclopropane fatty-acyl-phospholipid synthase-like methyltransferase
LTDHWFEPLADHLGAAYLRYSFTKGTEQEVAFLVDALGLAAGDRLLDVGCGPGRHAHAFAARGIAVVGVDISQRFVAIAQERTPDGAPASFHRMDARRLTFGAEFDAAISLCQGAFGLVGPGDDIDVLTGIARALNRSGRFAVSAFSSYFQVRYPQEAGQFDVDTGVHHERTVLKNEAGSETEADLWTTCYTARELRLLCDRAGLHVDHVWSVEPGHYEREPPTIESPELLLVGRRG